MLKLQPGLRRAGHVRGLSLVELMIGIAVGMFVVAAAATLVATQLTENRRMQLELQVQQDLRATADIITRELRRSASIAQFNDVASYVWTPGSLWQPNDNVPATPASGPSSEVTFQQARSPNGVGSSGFRLSNGTVQTLLSGWGWQPLTDTTTMTVTAFSIDLASELPIRVACAKLCADGTDNCWPTVTVRNYTIDITGRSTNDAQVVRSLRSNVRVRNEILEADPGLGTRACPA